MGWNRDGSCTPAGGGFNANRSSVSGGVFGTDDLPSEKPPSRRSVGFSLDQVEQAEQRDVQHMQEMQRQHAMMQRQQQQQQQQAMMMQRQQQMQMQAQAQLLFSCRQAPKERSSTQTDRTAITTGYYVGLCLDKGV